jgi:hypothetical protein
MTFTETNVVWNTRIKELRSQIIGVATAFTVDGFVVCVLARASPLTSGGMIPSMIIG